MYGTEIGHNGNTHSPLQSGSQPRTDQAAPESNFWGDDGFTFGDILDAINPFKHIPLVSDFFSGKGEPMSGGSKMIGGALFGGIVGLFGAFGSNVVEQETGKTPTQHLAGTFTKDTPNYVLQQQQVTGVSLLMLDAQSEPTDELIAANLTEAIERYRVMTGDDTTDDLLDELRELADQKLSA